MCVVVCSFWHCKLFLFKQKTAYELRMSDWSLDVCSSDLPQSRAKAPTAADLDIWIRANLPVSAPGSLSRAESLAITEYVMRRNGRYGGATAMTAETATRLRLR